MLTRKEEKLIRSLHTKKGRKDSGLCLLESQNVIDAAGDAVQFVFTNQKTGEYKDLVTTETPPPIAAVAKIPEWTDDAIAQKNLIVVLDGIQDPGNVGAVLRLCLGFSASLILVESADPTSPKVIRSSVGAMFLVPWKSLKRSEVPAYIEKLHRPIYRLENKGKTEAIDALEEKAVLIAGNEGKGIGLDIEGTSVAINHEDALESLNVGHALAIAMHAQYAR